MREDLVLIQKTAFREERIRVEGAGRKAGQRRKVVVAGNLVVRTKRRDLEHRKKVHALARMVFEPWEDHPEEVVVYYARLERVDRQEEEAAQPPFPEGNQVAVVARLAAPLLFPENVRVALEAVEVARSTAQLLHWEGAGLWAMADHLAWVCHLHRLHPLASHREEVHPA
jgi:hypothetical protein